MSRIYQRPAAQRDLIEHFVYLAENADESIADRFLESAQDTFAQLAQAPLMGSPVAIKTAELAYLRKWRVKNFEKFLIFYSTLPDGVSIVRVLHAAQDWWKSLGYEI
jgi:toxin ParE1/3/4